MIDNFNKHIHQIWWQSGNTTTHWENMKFPEYTEYQKTYTDFAEKNNWKYTLWQEDTILELVKSEFPQYYDEFIKLDSIIKKVDCARLMILYVFGGLYVDIDSYLKRDLNKFLNLTEIIRDEYDYTMWHIHPKMEIRHTYDLIVGQEKTIYEYYYNKFGIQIPKCNNAVIFCKSGLEIFKEIIDIGFKRKNNSILDSFGVHTFSLKIYDEMSKYVNNIFDNPLNQKNPKILTLPYIYFYEMDVDTDIYIRDGGNIEFINDTRQYIVHKFDGNWDGERYDMFLNRIK
jgi:mannosyltransferase OCH1-like enzyme